MKKNIYLAGAVSGLPEEQVKGKFQRKAEELIDKGFIVYNPIDQIWNTGLKAESWQTIMKACIQIMMNCEEVHLLPCWNNSKGARLERDIALRLGMTIIYH